jgi:uncharacterized membrane protein
MAEPISSTGNTTGLPANLAAGLCAILILLGGIVFYLIEKKDAFVRHWAVQSIFFGGTWFFLQYVAIPVLILIAGILPGVHFVLVPLLSLAWLVLHFVLFIFWFIGIVKAFQGERWEYPLISAYCRRLFPTLVP